MFENIKEKIKLINLLGLSFEEFDLIYSIYLCQQERGVNNEFNKDFNQYYEINKYKYDYASFIKRAEEEGLLEYHGNLNTDKHISFNKILLTDKFKNNLTLDMDVCWKEVLEVYPKFMMVDNKKFSTKQTTKNLKLLYFNLVTRGGNTKLHKEFLGITDIFYENDRPITSREGSVKLEKWIVSWENVKDDIRAELFGEVKTQTNIFY
jgi:hypothetical protein